MSALAHVFEAAGLTTVGISLVRAQAEAGQAPRMLHCQFPLGRPLGKPGDAEFQLDVLRRALALTSRTDVPVLVEHPVVIDDEADMPAVCPMPPYSDPDAHPAVAEARGLAAAYRRNLAATGRTLVGRVTPAEGIDGLVERFVQLSSGASLDDVGFDETSIIAASQDVRAFYEEAALALVDHVPAARQVESWLYATTETGAVLKAARAMLKGAEAPFGVWFYLVPDTQSD